MNTGLTLRETRLLAEFRAREERRRAAEQATREALLRWRRVPVLMRWMATRVERR